MTDYKVIYLRLAENGEEIEDKQTFLLKADTLDDAEDEARAIWPPGAHKAKISGELLVERTLMADFDA